MTSVAIVGGGFGGIGAAVMLGREGYHDVTVFERGDRVGGRVELQHLSRHRLRRALAPLRVLLRAQSQLVAALRAGGRDPGLHGGRGSPARGARPRPAAHRGHGSARSTRQRGRWLLETTAGPHEADVLVTACGQLSVPSIPAIPGLDDFAGPVVPHGSLARRRAARGQAGGAGGHRLQLHSGGSVHPARGCAARRLPALAGLDDPEDGLRVRPPGAPAVRARRRCCSGSIAS